MSPALGQRMVIAATAPLRALERVLESHFMKDRPLPREASSEKRYQQIEQRAAEVRRMLEEIDVREKMQARDNTARQRQRP